MRGLLPSPEHRLCISRETCAIQVLVALLLCAPVLFNLSLALPGTPGFADLAGTVNYHWQVHQDGLFGVAESQMLMYPTVVDRIVLDGFPLDALASAPFAWLLGWRGGFSVFTFACLLSLGCASAWLAKNWWGSPVASAVAGVVAQCNPFLLRELVDGRSTQLFGAIFLPLMLVFLLRGLTLQCLRSSALAGLMLGLGTLAYWYYGVFFGLCGLAMIGLARADGRPVLRQLLACGAALLALTALPIGYTALSLADVPGMSTGWTESVFHGGNPISLMEILEERDLGTAVSLERVIAPQAVAGLLLLAGAWFSPRRRLLSPVVWLLSGLLLAAGPILFTVGSLVIPGPFQLFQAAPFLRRLWWPDRALVILLPAISLLVGGGLLVLSDRLKLSDSRRRVAVWICSAALVAEAFLVIPGLPLPTTWGAASAASEVLSKAEGPVLIVPMGSGEREPDTRMLIDQIHHGRMMVNGPMTPGVSAAPAAYNRFAETSAMAALLGCEQTRSAPLTGEIDWQALRDLGISTVYLERNRAEALAQGSARFEACIRSLLGEPESTDGPYQLYALP